jgi:hypothetical protein
MRKKLVRLADGWLAYVRSTLRLSCGSDLRSAAKAMARKGGEREGATSYFLGSPSSPGIFLIQRSMEGRRG